MQQYIYFLNGMRCLQSKSNQGLSATFGDEVVIDAALTGILLPAHIWAESAFKMQNFPPIASVAKPLVELVTPSPWPSGPEFKPQL